MVASIGVTGARGIVGRRFVEIASEAGGAVSSFAGDIRDPAAVQGWIEAVRPNVIVHCAALVDVGRAQADPPLAFAINVGGTLNLLRSLRDEGRRVWVFHASSSHVYAPSDRPLREDDRSAPRTIYALTKHLAEETAAYFSKDSNIDLCTGRIFSLYDKEQVGSYLYPSIAARLRTHNRSTPFVVRDGDAVRDFSSAVDVAKMIQALMARRAVGVVNVGSGVGLPVVEQLSRVFGRDVAFTTDAVGVPSMIVADISKLKTLIG